MRCRYNAVNFLTNIHKRHPIARPLGRGMGCLLWIQHLIDILPQFLWLFVQYLILLDRVITALDCSCFQRWWGTMLITLCAGLAHQDPCDMAAILKTTTSNIYKSNSEARLYKCASVKCLVIIWEVKIVAALRQAFTRWYLMAKLKHWKKSSEAWKHNNFYSGKSKCIWKC